MKLTVKNFRKFFSNNFIEKKIRHFFGKFEKTIFATKKKGGELCNFSKKIRHNLSVGFDVLR